MALLETKQVTKSFGGVHAVDHVDLTFEAGKISALIGPNGSGKTTLINTITGILQMDGGVIVVSDTVKLSQIASQNIATYGITRTFQNSRLIQQMSVLDNVLMVLTERNVFRSLFERRRQFHVNAAKDVLKKVGLWEKREENAENLSYGQRKLLEMARAVLMNAKIYFFDEPFAGLFPEIRKIISGFIQELRAGGAAVILVEHDMELVRGLADHCYVLDSGKVIAEGAPGHVLKQPNVIEAYLGK